MKILLVEDDGYKAQALSEWLKSNFSDLEIVSTSSYKEGCLTALDGFFDLLILDMTLPLRVSEGRSSKETLVNGGELIIRELLDEGMEFKALIITQYETFNGETIEAIEERLIKMCGDRFLGCVGYNSQDDSWKTNLKNIMSYAEGFDS